MVLLAAVEASSKLEEAIRSLVEHGSQLGFTIIKALIVFLVGRLVINLLNKLVRKILSKRDIDPSVKTFVGSLVNVSLTILLIISVVGALGVQTTSFAALLASAGVAVGMALSGNLSNFAGGLIILLFKPYKVGDYIEAQGVGGFRCLFPYPVIPVQFPGKGNPVCQYMQVGLFFFALRTAVPDDGVLVVRQPHALHEVVTKFRPVRIRKGGAFLYRRTDLET